LFRGFLIFVFGAVFLIILFRHYTLLDMEWGRKKRKLLCFYLVDFIVFFIVFVFFYKKNAKIF